MLKITPLVENTSISPRYIKKHGLSLYIETVRHKLLFDVGPDDTFLRNAEKMGINLADVDIVVLSHCHFDHCGGMALFLSINTKAKVYIQKSAVGKRCYYAHFLPINIGTKGSWLSSDRIFLVDGAFTIDEELTLFSDVDKNDWLPEINRSIKIKHDRKYIPDDFDHEQYLVINDAGKKYILTGCSHKGIVNIIDTFTSLYNADGAPAVVIGGFHLYDAGKFRYESTENITRIMKLLKKTGYKYVTCHCTGKKAYKIMKHYMKDDLEQISVGSVLVYN